MKDTAKFIIFVFLGALCLMTDAFYNGFPIVYSDTSTYIASGFEWETPFDRPITYGLFLRLFSLNGLSLWFVVFFQSLILSYLVFLLVKVVTDNKSFLKFGLLTLVFLSLFTGVSWTVSQLMPDIFTSIALLCTSLILLGSFKKSTLILLYALFFISIAMHLSHVLLFGIILMGLLSLQKFILPATARLKLNKRIFLMLVLTVVSVVTMGSAMSKSKHVFFMGAMVEHGIVKKYLGDYCDSKQYKLCAYKDSLPNRAYEFVWDEKSPFYKIGGWKETKREFNEIIYGTLTDPKYIFMHVMESLKATVQQLMRFSIGDGNGSFLEGLPLHKRVSTYFPRDLNAFTSSKQNQLQWGSLKNINFLFEISIVLSVLLILFLLIRFEQMQKGILKGLAILFFMGIILNAWDCGTFANAIDRLGCKMIWLIPFMALLSFWKIWVDRERLESR